MDEYKRPGWLSRLALSIPFLQRWRVKYTAKSIKIDGELTDTLNRAYAYMFSPALVDLYNSGKIGCETFLSPAYFRSIVIKMFGKKAKRFAEQIRVEKATLKADERIFISLLYLPSQNEIGQTYLIAYVVNRDNKASYYSWEWSFGQSKMICTWEDKEHLNFGACNDKVAFVKRVIELSNS